MSKTLHTCVRVQNLEESIHVSTKKHLSFKNSQKKNFPRTQIYNHVYSIRRWRYELELTYNYGHGPYEIGGGYGHIAISAKDLEGLHAEHVAKNYDVTELKGLPGHPPQTAFVKRLDGYKIRSNARKIVRTWHSTHPLL